MKLKTLSIRDLRRELERRERSAGKLAKQRDKLAARLASLDAELTDLGAAPKRRGRPPKLRGPGRKAAKARRGRKRAKNRLTLADALAAAVRAGSVVSPADAAKRVKANGYKSKSKTFGIQVATTLAKDKRFKRKGRGQYERVA